jgi:hypothetical protein
VSSDKLLLNAKITKEKSQDNHKGKISGEFIPTDMKIYYTQVKLGHCGT